VGYVTYSSLDSDLVSKLYELPNGVQFLFKEIKFLKKRVGSVQRKFEINSYKSAVSFYYLIMIFKYETRTCGVLSAIASHGLMNKI